MGSEPGVLWHGEPPTHLSLAVLEALGVRHAFTTRHHGSLEWVSAPSGPFPPGAPVLAALGLDAGAVRYARQVHGVDCLVVDGAGPGLVGDGDALATSAPGRPLAVFTADCLPVVLADPGRRVLAVAHAGWRGTVGGILGRLVASLAGRLGADPGRLVAAVGPSIGPCCYEVDEPVMGPLRAAFPADWARWTRPAGPGRWRLDLWQASQDQLAAAGLPPAAVWNPRLCTACRRDLFFSYRKEGAGLRLATVACLA